MMNRLLKFRQRNVNNGSWHYWGYIDGEWVQPLVQDNYYNPDLSDQYTGLPDKDGKEIYEGDIIRTVRGLREVSYSDETAMFVALNNSVETALWAHLRDGLEDITEIIGDIYENPELLS
jgi:uncharacterized phage protein (TIGR01671 family)